MSEPRRILVVEDERKIAEIIKAYLEKDGYTVTVTASGAEALTLADSSRYDLIVLDLMLPDLSGEDVCSALRQHSDVPIIMVTARTAEDEKIYGLNIGADDYLAKPFSPRELAARVKSILRRVHSDTEFLAETISFDNERLVIDVSRFEVRLDGEPVALTPHEFNLLLTLARHPGRVYSRHELISKVQGYDYEGYERTIDAHVKNLRQKIEAEPKKPRYIQTVFGVGYKFAT